MENPNAGLFQIAVTPRPNASLTEIERVVDSVIASVKSSPLTEKEVQKVKNSIAVSTVTGLQSGLARAEQLAQGEVFDKNPLSYVDMLSRYGKVTAADVQRVANKYLTDGRMVMSMVPAGKLDMASKPDKPYTNVTPARPMGTK
jgi:zinc protease